jgi:hypothetical protein
MPKISQPTLALMIMLFRGLSRRPDDVTAPLVRDMDMEMMEWDVMPHDVRRQFAREGWDFQQTLSELHAGRLRDTYASEVPEFDTEDGRSRLLETMAEYLCRKIDLLKWDVRGIKTAKEELLRRLEIDGYEYRGGRLLHRDTAPVNLSEEADLLTELIKESSLPHELEILHHYQKGDELYAASQDEPSLGEWRKFFEAILRDVADTTAPYRSDVTKNTGTMKDVLDYLTALGFFDKDERNGSYGAAYGFFSAGTKPGILPREHAKAGMVLALTFGQLLLKKYLNWKKNGYRFSH